MTIRSTIFNAIAGIAVFAAPYSIAIAADGVPSVIGFRCEGAPLNFPQLAAEESDLPPCASIIPIRSMWSGLSHSNSPDAHFRATRIDERGDEFVEDTHLTMDECLKATSAYSIWECQDERQFDLRGNPIQP